jgi:ribosomal protein L40E
MEHIITCIIFFGLLWFVLRENKKFKSIPTYDQYVKNLTGNQKPNSCKKCGGTALWLRPFGYGPGTITNLHICRTCGAVLYKSHG